MKVSFEYGHGLMTADLPDSTDILIHPQPNGNGASFQAGS